MESISPALLEKIQTAFAEECKKSKRISAIIKKVRDGTADLNDSAEYSALIGRILGEALGDNITFDVLPDNTLFWNIAQDVIKPMLEQNCELVNIMATDCQQIVYDAAKIGIKVKAPARNEDRIKGILDAVTTPGLTDTQLKTQMETYTENYTRSVHDEFIQEQARRADAAGLSAKVVRVAGNCCEWCSKMAGIYNYADVKKSGSDVWRRHVNCNCSITYQTEKGSQRVDNYATEETTKRRRNSLRATEEEAVDFVKRQNLREMYIKDMVASGWTEKQAAIYFNKNRLWEIMM